MHCRGILEDRKVVFDAITATNHGPLHDDRNFFFLYVHKSKTEDAQIQIFCVEKPDTDGSCRYWNMQWQNHSYASAYRPLHHSRGHRWNMYAIIIQISTQFLIHALFDKYIISHPVNTIIYQWSTVIQSHSQVICKHLLGGTKENHNKPLSGQPDSNQSIQNKRQESQLPKATFHRKPINRSIVNTDITD